MKICCGLCVDAYLSVSFNLFYTDESAFPTQILSQAELKSVVFCKENKTK